MNKHIQVAAAVIRKNGRTLICSRPAGTTLADFFEFPGGKCEPGESIGECVVRELREELGVGVAALDIIHTLEHDYPDKSVRVHFIRCILLPGSPDPAPLDHQQIRWAETDQLPDWNFLPADKPLARLLADAAKARY